MKLFDDKLLGITPGVKNPEVERLEKEIEELSKLYGEIAVGKQKEICAKSKPKYPDLSVRFKK